MLVLIVPDNYQYVDVRFSNALGEGPSGLATPAAFFFQNFVRELRFDQTGPRINPVSEGTDDPRLVS
ncbi:MAG: hypothetical protein EBY80_17015 [Actinobacteria bacterium]|nr:hypothetical protein [Actinomycetota bacterium]